MVLCTWWWFGRRSVVGLLTTSSPVRVDGTSRWMFFFFTRTDIKRVSTCLYHVGFRLDVNYYCDFVWVDISEGGLNSYLLLNLLLCHILTRLVQSVVQVSFTKLVQSSAINTVGLQRLVPRFLLYSRKWKCIRNIVKSQCEILLSTTSFNQRNKVEQEDAQVNKTK